MFPNAFAHAAPRALAKAIWRDLIHRNVAGEGASGG
jgi:hypothetical protein